MNLNKESFFYELMQMINLKFSSNLSRKLKEMVKKVDAKISKSKDLKDNEKDQYNAEIEKFKKLKAEVDVMKGEKYYEDQFTKLEVINKNKMKSFKEEGPLQKFFFNLALKSTNIM